MNEQENEEDKELRKLLCACVISDKLGLEMMEQQILSWHRKKAAGEIEQLKQIIIEDVPHKYQGRLLKILKGE